MPTYDYECQACGHKFDHFQSMSSRKLRKCPECSKPKLIRLVGAGAGLIFKGSGFYETDYKRAGSSGPDSDSGKSDDGSASKDSTKDSTKDSAKKGDTKPSGDSSKSESSSGGSSKKDAGSGSDA